MSVPAAREYFAHAKKYGLPAENLTAQQQADDLLDIADLLGRRTISTRLMPHNKKWPIAALLEACRAYQLRPREKLTFEYVLLDGVNDSAIDYRGRLLTAATRAPPRSG